MYARVAATSPDVASPGAGAIASTSTSRVVEMSASRLMTRGYSLGQGVGRGNSYAALAVDVAPFRPRRSRARPLRAWVLLHSHMRRYALIIPGVAAFTWGVLAIVLGSPSLRLLSGSSSPSRVSPSCLPATLEHTAALPGTNVQV